MGFCSVNRRYHNTVEECKIILHQIGGHGVLILLFEKIAVRCKKQARRGERLVFRPRPTPSPAVFFLSLFLPVLFSRARGVAARGGGAVTTVPGSQVKINKLPSVHRLARNRCGRIICYNNILPVLNEVTATAK